MEAEKGRCKSVMFQLYGTILVPVTVSKRLSLEHLLYYLRQRLAETYVLAHICLFVCQQTNSKTRGWIFIKFG